MRARSCDGHGARDRLAIVRRSCGPGCPGVRRKSAAACSSWNPGSRRATLLRAFSADRSSVADDRLGESAAARAQLIRLAFRDGAVPLRAIAPLPQLFSPATERVPDQDVGLLYARGLARGNRRTEVIDARCHLAAVPRSNHGDDSQRRQRSTARSTLRSCRCGNGERTSPGVRAP